MTTQDTANISFDANIHLEDRDDRWAARIEPLGMIIYGKTPADAATHAHRAVRSAVNSLNAHASTAAVRSFLNDRGARCEIVDDLHLPQEQRTDPMFMTLNQ